MALGDSMKEGVTSSENVEQLRKAAAFMAAAREQWRNEHRSNGGPRGLGIPERGVIKLARLSSATVSALATGEDRASQRAMEMFEVLCRRGGMSLPPELRPAVYKILLGELNGNAALLKARQLNSIVTATVYNGTLGGLLSDPELKVLHGVLDVFKRAARSHPCDPRAYLRTIARSVEALQADPEFSTLRDTPGVIRRAAIGHAEPKTFLRREMARGKVAGVKAPRADSWADTVESGDLDASDGPDRER